MPPPMTAAPPPIAAANSGCAEIEGCQQKPDGICERVQTRSSASAAEVLVGRREKGGEER
jgi:hypothetical protein